MTQWRKRVKIKEFLTDKEDYQSVQKAMNQVANELQKHGEFALTNICTRLRNIPKGDDIITACDYANKLLDKVYDIADEQGIWIE